MRLGHILADFAEWLETASDTDCKAKAEEVAALCKLKTCPSNPLGGVCSAIADGYLNPDEFSFLADVLAMEQRHFMAFWESEESTITVETQQLKTRINGLILRVQDAKFWARRFTRAAVRSYEAKELRWGYIGNLGAYLSNRTLERMIHRTQRSAAAIAEACAISPEGEVLELQKIIDASISNPKNRRLELVVRMKGVAEYAQRQGMIGYAVTLTAPSKYHRMKTLDDGRLVKNDKWEEFGEPTPKDTAAYLGELWAQTRAQLKKSKIDLAGLRTCEPHKDGTPHWHMVIFFKAKDVRTVLKTIKKKFLEVDGQERGAKKHRVQLKRIKTSKEKDLTYAAVAYAIGYISKNLDGAGLATDTEAGIDAVNGAQRATAWARVWGIRQFQTFGAPSITVYRELRKVREEARKILLDLAKNEVTAIAGAAHGLLNGNIKPMALAATEAMRMGRADVLEKLTALRELQNMGEFNSRAIVLGDAWAAADQGQFRRYIEAMKKSPVGLLKIDKLNAYGEQIKVIRGLVTELGEVETRADGWQVCWGGLHAAQQRRAEAQPIAPRTCGNNCNPEGVAHGVYVEKPAIVISDEAMETKAVSIFPNFEQVRDASEAAKKLASKDQLQEINFSASAQAPKRARAKQKAEFLAENPFKDVDFDYLATYARDIQRRRLSVSARLHQEFLDSQF
jgi:hypothetical protein